MAVGDLCTTGSLRSPAIQFQFNYQERAYIEWQYQYRYKDTLNSSKLYFYISDYKGIARMAQKIWIGVGVGGVQCY